MMSEAYCKPKLLGCFPVARYFLNIVHLYTTHPSATCFGSKHLSIKMVIAHISSVA